MKTLNLSLLICCAAAMFLTSCSKDAVDYTSYYASHGGGSSSGGGTSDDTNHGVYFKGTVNGTAVDLEVTNQLSSAYAEGSTSGVNTEIDPYLGDMSAFLSGIDDNHKQGFGAFFGTYNTPASAESAYFNSFITTGPWAYDPDDTQKPNSKQIWLYYNDTSGAEYNTRGDQTGSTLNIISVTHTAPTTDTKQGVIVKLTFNCKMYPFSGVGDPIVITNGEATLFLEDLMEN